MTNSHKQRLITSAILLPALAAVLYFEGWVLLAAILVVSVLAQLEFYNMFWSGKERSIYKGLGCIFGVLLVVAGYFEQPYAMLGIIAGAFWFSSLTFLKEYGVDNNNAANFSVAQVITLGLCYIPLLFQFALHLSSAELLLILLAAFASDIGGYYVGCSLGKHKVWPRVSPKKSWEGSLGGMVSCCAVCTAIGLTFGKEPWWVWISLGVLLNLASQTGDFFESALKRTLAIKDSGTLLPGHGGLLDRLDSVLLVLPVYALVRTLVTLF